MLRSLIALVFLFVTVPSHAQNDWDSYQPARIDTVISAHKSAIEQAQDSYIDSPGFHMWLATRYSRLQIRATYTGEQRPVNTDTKHLISSWFKARGLDSTYVDLYESEVLFRTKSGEYWLPMQSKPLSYLEREEREGAQIQLYATFMGAYTWSSEPLSSVFCVNTFQHESE